MMSKRERRGWVQDVSLPLVNARAAGIDIGGSSHFVAVPTDMAEAAVQEFSCFTEDLGTMSWWLKACGVTTVAIESTGVYWIPVFELLDWDGFEVLLVNARQVSHVLGSKSDVSDCQW